MKNKPEIGFFALATCMLASVNAQAFEAIPTTSSTRPQALSDSLFKKMDANADAKISKVEFLEFGSDTLKKKGKRVDVFELEKKFYSYDIDQDGYITAQDPTSKSPAETLVEKIIGRWTGTKDNGNRIEFVFMKDSKADLIQRGVSMREKAVEAGGDMTYKLINPTKKPIGLDLIAKGQQGSATKIQCIIRFLSDDQMQLRMAGGGPYSRRPREFPKNGSIDTITLKRTL